MRNERTLKMMEEFMSLHEKGLSIHEIAENYDLVDSTVYKLLGEIAQANGVSRSELLKVVHVGYTRVGTYTPLREIDTKAFFARSDKIASEISEMRAMIRDTVQNMERFEECMA